MFRVFLSVSVFLLTLAACVWATVAIVRAPIERDLTKRSLEALEPLNGMRADHYQLAFVGRDGRLSGEVKSQELKEAAEQQLAKIYGARLVSMDLAVRPYDLPWLEVEQVDAETVRIEGLLPAEGERIEDGELIDGLRDAADIDFDVEYRDRIEPTPWLAAVKVVALELLPVAKGGRVVVRDGQLSVGGELPDAETNEFFAAAATEEFGDSISSHQFDLTVAPPDEPSSFEMFPPKDGKIVVAGRLADLDAAQALLSLLRSSGEWIIEDQIVVAENTTPAPWLEPLTFVLPSVLIEVVCAGLKIEGDRLRLDGQISEDMLVAISDITEQNFPQAEYEVQNRLRMMTPPREAMVSIVSSPGKVQLKGLLAEDSLKERVVSAVKGAMGSGELLTDELQVGPNVLEANWVDALVKLVPPYVQQVKRGGLTIYSNILAVEAVIESDADRDSIWAMTEQYFPDDKYRRLLELRFPEEVEGGIAGEGEDPEAN
ncbi:MAG: osmotically-inducible protein OsmY [Verrucomicrobiales bacterium]|jgi:osmotically-inducible protein OsmY